MLVDNRYIVIYDAVRDARTEGRFVWNNFEDEPMPLIHQLRPGAKPRTVRGPALTVDGIPRLPAVCEDKDTRGVVYDGYGDFLTVVTHRAGIEAYPHGDLLAGRPDELSRLLVWKPIVARVHLEKINGGAGRVWI